MVHMDTGSTAVATAAVKRATATATAAPERPSKKAKLSAEELAACLAQHDASEEVRANLLQAAQVAVEAQP